MLGDLGYIWIMQFMASMHNAHFYECGFRDSWDEPGLNNSFILHYITYSVDENRISLNKHCITSTVLKWGYIILCLQNPKSDC